MQEKLTMAASSGQQLEPDEADSASQKIDNPEISVATTPQEGIGQNVYCPTRPTLKITLLGDEWNSSAGGLSTINRELAIHFSKHPKMEVSLLVPEGACKDEGKRAAQSCGITVVDAKKRPAYDPLDWLSFPPPDLSMDIVVGHGVKLGRQGQVIRDSSRFNNCKWVQVVHTAPEDLSKYKSYADPISKGERKHQDEVDLCKLANLVVPVGPRLEEFYSSYLRRCKKDQDVFSITPGLFDREFGDLEQAPNENADFKVLIFGRGDDEDFELKGYNIAAEAFTDQRLKQKPYHLIFVGAPEGKQGEVRQKLLQCGIAKEQLTVRKFIQSRDRMKDLLCEADLAIMPSRSEGFGLVALEALSAGLPILVGKKSGFAKALENVLFGKSCIVDSDDPTKWAEAIEAVCVRHGMRLKEIKALRASYETTYCWKEQCEALVERMWRMVHGSSSENGNVPKVDSPAEQKLVAEACGADCRTSEQQPLLHVLDEQTRATGTNNGTALSFSNKSQSLQNWSKKSISGSSLIPDYKETSMVRVNKARKDGDDIQPQSLTSESSVTTGSHTMGTSTADYSTELETSISSTSSLPPVSRIVATRTDSESFSNTVHNLSSVEADCRRESTENCLSCHNLDNTEHEASTTKKPELFRHVSWSPPGCHGVHTNHVQSIDGRRFNHSNSHPANIVKSKVGAENKKKSISPSSCEITVDSSPNTLTATSFTVTGSYSESAKKPCDDLSPLNVEKARRLSLTDSLSSGESMSLPTSPGYESGYMSSEGPPVSCGTSISIIHRSDLEGESFQNGIFKLYNYFSNTLGYKCYLDKLELSEIAENKFRYAVRRVQHSDFLFICVSPELKKIFDSPVDEISGQLEDDESCMLRLVSDLILSDLANHGSNRKGKFMTIILDGSSKQDVPSFLDSFMKFLWPKDERKIRCIIEGLQSDILPAPVSDVKTDPNPDPQVVGPAGLI